MKNQLVHAIFKWENAFYFIITQPTDLYTPKWINQKNFGLSFLGHGINFNRLERSYFISEAFKLKLTNGITYKRLIKSILRNDNDDNIQNRGKEYFCVCLIIYSVRTEFSNIHPLVNIDFLIYSVNKFRASNNEPTHLTTMMRKYCNVITIHTP